MIICRTPFRVSLFGGGTDFPEFYKKYGGAVIAGSIDKYCYVTLRELPKFHNHKYEVHYSKIEKVNNINKINHPVIKACYNIHKVKPYINLIYDADMPAKSGLGTSSSFTVSIIKSIYKYQKKKINKQELLKKSIYLERGYLKESVGCQDQTLAVYGGFNFVSFDKKKIKVKKIKISDKYLKKLENNLFLIYTNNSRYASKIEKKKIFRIEQKKQSYMQIKEMTLKALNIMEKGKNIDLIGHLLRDYWEIKKKLSNEVTHKKIDEIYKKGLKAGALGGKILGAGGGGFMLFYCPKKNHKKFKEQLKNYYMTKFTFTSNSSRIIHSSEKNNIGLFK
jgi:D-glycero-alpha-D-manno-heptose-7-phosphate kinase